MIRIALCMSVKKTFSTPLCITFTATSSFVAASRARWTYTKEAGGWVGVGGCWWVLVGVGG